MSSSKSRVHHARILAGTAFVNSGQGITDLVIPLLIVARTGRSFDFCIAFAIQQIPTLSLLPLVGAWLGRRNCRLVLAGSVLVRCAAIGVIGRTAVTGFDLEVLLAGALRSWYMRRRLRDRGDLPYWALHS